MIDVMRKGLTGILQHLVATTALLGLLLVLMVPGRGAAADWAANYGGIAGAKVYTKSTATDAAGNLYLAGYFDGTTFTLGSVTLTRIGTQDAFVAKVDASGTVLWAKNFGGSWASAYGQSIAVDGSGNVYLGGYFHDANLTTPALTKIGLHDAFALKLNSTGAVTWAKNFGGSLGYAGANSIAVDGSGNVYLGGYFQTASLTTPALAKIGTSDVFALKLNSAGTIIWAKNFGGFGASCFNSSIAVDGSGNVYLAGNFTASLIVPALANIGSSDAFAFKLNSSGTTLWARNFGGSGASAYGQSIAVDGSGSVYLGGYFVSANLTTPSLTKMGSYDAFAFKLDSTGAVTWAKNFGGSGASTFGRSIAVDGSGNVYLGGSFGVANLTTPALTRGSETDAFAFKLDSTGVVTWAKNFSGASLYSFGIGTNSGKIAVDGSGNVYLGGDFQGNLTTPALTKIGANDAFAFKLDSTGSLTWAKNFGALAPGGSAAVYATAKDAAGNTYLAGDFNGITFTFGSVTLTSIGSANNAFVAKLDASGTVLWAKNFGGSVGSVSATAKSIALDGSGNIYLGGYFQGNLTTPALTGQTGAPYAFAFKLDSSGTVTWAKSFGGSGAYTYGSNIAVDGFGNVYLGGYFYNTNLTTPALTKIGTRDAFALKLDSTGAVTWAKNFGGSGASVNGLDMAVDGIGNVYLAGDFTAASLTTPPLTKVGSTDAFAFKLNSTGAVTWAKNFGGSGASASSSGIAVDGSGNIYLGGYFDTANLTTPALTKIGTRDAFAFRLDSTGAVTWSKNFGGSGASVYGNDIKLDGSGNVYLGGYFDTANLTTPTLTRIGTRDAFALMLRSNGAITWAKNFGGGGATNATCWSITVDGNGNVNLGGYLGSGNLTTPPLTRIGGADALIIFRQLSSNLNFAAGPNGTISGVTSQTVGYGDSASAMTAAPNPNYHFVNWTGTNGFATTTDNPLTVVNVTASKSITANFAIDQYTVTVSLLGSGGGSVNSSLPEPAGQIACTSGSSSGCSHSFDYGSLITLLATTDWKSTFTGWGLPCSGTGSCTITVNGASGVSATFAMVPRVRIGGTTPVEYGSLQDGYDNAGAGDTLYTKVFTFSENLLFTRNIAVTLDGGYSDDFASVTGFTTVLGSLTIRQGTATLSNLIID